MPLKLREKLRSVKITEESVAAIRPAVVEKSVKKKLTKGEVMKRAMRLENFPELFLGMQPYEWQVRVLSDLNYKDSRVAMKAANGSGKTSVVAASAVLWHMLRFPGSLVVTTAGVWRQVEDQLWPSLRKLAGMLGPGWRVTASQVEYSNGSRAIGFSTTDPGKFEGWHRQGPSENLLMIVDEAKTVGDSVYEAIERCQPSRLLVMSSPGGPQGAFYRAFTKEAHLWKTHSVTSYDCPHIPESWIEQQFEKWGEKHPLVRSMIFGEFMDLGSENLVINYNVLQNCFQNPPMERKGGKVAFCDFAAGGDENVLCVRDGNKVEPLVCWKERDTMASVGRFIMEFEKFNLNPENIYGDAGGLGIPMCDALAESGWGINRVNNGERAYDDRHYANRGSEMWYTAARKMEKCEVIVPEDDVLIEQLTTRMGKTNSRGKLILESKQDMRSKGIDSPDRGDALVGCITCGGESNNVEVSSRMGIFEQMEDQMDYGHGIPGMNAG
jgi:phage terminase large subunit